MDNIVKAAFTRPRVKTRPIYQYDYGMILQIVGVELPVSYEVHFGNSETGDSVTSIGGTGGVSIPDSLLLTGETVYAWLYMHTGSSDGETVYVAEIPVIKRAKPTHEEPTPVQQTEIEQAMAALNQAVLDAQGYAQDAQSSAQDAQVALETLLGSGIIATDDGNGNVTISFGGA